MADSLVLCACYIGALSSLVRVHLFNALVNLFSTNQIFRQVVHRQSDDDIQVSIEAGNELLDG